MGLVHRALTILSSREVVDIATSTDLVRALPEIIDRALAGSPCPFDTYEESLVAFSRALYALRLEDGRCVMPGSPAGCGFYDPHNLYNAPPIETVSYSGKETLHGGEIPSSFGIDFIDVTLSDAPDGRPLTVEFHQAPGSVSQFTVEVRELKYVERGPSLRVSSTSRAVQGTLKLRSPNRKLSYVVPAVDKADYDRLGLIITRVDADEHLDPLGAYTVVLRPSESNRLVCAPLSASRC